VDVAEAQRDMTRLDALRPHIARLTKLLGRAENSEMALVVTALEGYALLKVLGKGSGLDALRRDMSVRFTRKTRARLKTRQLGLRWAKCKAEVPCVLGSPSSGARLFALRPAFESSSGAQATFVLLDNQRGQSPCGLVAHSNGRESRDACETNSPTRGDARPL
jgi:hypothetical protein